MIKVSVLYPNDAGATFDMAYYTGHHMPMVQRKCGAACKSITAEQGLSGGEPGSKPAYIAAGHLTFDSVEAFQKSFGPARERDTGRHSELHQHKAGRADQQGDAVRSAPPSPRFF